ncbi:MAG: D-glucuronyl C5-epimerase family protein [Candidatus Stygibacter australis]|nr:D-glucuronyl C5-epimerase family protein [Candidatus Stygibacter australis]MDP8322305.1 D-glucuronyl C5-epimerase family protein [Candidatus Stygibacter australis]
MNRFNKLLITQIVLLEIVLLLTIVSVEILYSPVSIAIRTIRQYVFRSSIVDKYDIGSDGIPVIDLGKIKGEIIGVQYIPVAIIQTGLEHFAKHDSSNIAKFLNCTNRIIETSVRQDSQAILTYRFHYPIYNMYPPWHSAMAQGQALQLMIRAHKITGNPRYLAFGDSLMNLMLLSIKQGGVTHKLTPDAWWYEEYADEHCRQIMVLNGMMYALLGLHEFNIYTGSRKAELLFNKGINALILQLPLYDRDGNSYYDILKTPAGGDYHQIHIKQLLELYQITGHEIFLFYHLKWKKFQNSPYLIQLFSSPSKMLIGVYLGIFLCLFILIESGWIIIEIRKKR